MPCTKEPLTAEVNWLVGVLRLFEIVFQSKSNRLSERTDNDKGDNNVQTTLIRTYCKYSRALSCYYHRIKVTQESVPMDW